MNGGPVGPMRFAGRYTIIERLAVGGMGEVFLARQEGIGGFARTVVLKTLLPDAEADEEAGDRFLDEARVAATLAHDNVVTVIEAGEHEGSPFIALEYVHGTNASTLRNRARKARVPVPVVVAARIVADAARGLAHAHRAEDAEGRPLRIIHRDVSPKNIFVRVDGTSKIGDFGIARSEHRLAKTVTGMVPGTLPYMSPEQASGDPLTPATDQFSLGIVLWELLMGERLFKGESATDTVARVMTYQAPAPSTLRKDAQVLDRVVARMLHHEPTRRFASLDDVASAIDACVPEARLDKGSKAVAAFVDTLCGDELRDRKTRIESGADTNLSIRRPGAFSSSLTVSSGSSSTEQTVPGLDAQADGAATRPDRKSGGVQRTPTEPGAAALPDTPRRRWVAAAAGALVIASCGALGWMLTNRVPTPEERTRAYLETARQQHPFLHREVFLAMAEVEGVDMKVAESIADPLVALLVERLELLRRHWTLASDARAERTAALTTSEQAITTRARALLAPLGDKFASAALDMWAYDSAAPLQWSPPPSVVDIQADLKSNAVRYMRSQAEFRRIAVKRMCERACTKPEVVVPSVMTLAAQREDLLARWADAPVAELEVLDDKTDSLEQQGQQLLAGPCGAMHGAAIASVAFHFVNDPDEWERLYPQTPSLLEAQTQRVAPSVH